MAFLVDPRIPRLSDTVNGRILDRAIRHSVFLERYKTQEVERIVNFYNRHVFPDLLKEYESRLARAFYKGADPGPWTTNRLREVIASAHQQMRVGTRIAYSELNKDLRALAMSEAEWQARALSEAVPSAFGLDFRTPSPVLMRELVNNNPFEGRLTKQWFNDLSAGLKTEAQKQATIGLAAGESLPKIVRRLRGAVAMTARHAETIVRTSVTHISNLARQATYLENQDVVKGWQFVATLDSRTTEICMATDGLVFPLGEGAHSYPPLHHQCRSTTAPVLKSWEELGIKGLKEAPAGARASMTGLVPAKQTYGTWLSNQPKWLQDQALGPARAKLFRRGTVPISRFVDQAGRPLTLKQLEELERKMGGHPPKKPKPPKYSKRPPIKTGKEIRLMLEQRIDSFKTQRMASFAKLDIIRKRLHKYKIGFNKYNEETLGARRLLTRMRNLNDHLERLDRMQVSMVSDALKVRDPITVNITMNPDPTWPAAKQKAWLKSVKDAKKFVRSVTSRKMLDKISFNAESIAVWEKDQRAFERAGNIFLTINNQPGTVVHEIGHVLDRNSSWYLNRSGDFLKRRIDSMPAHLKIKERLRDITGIEDYREWEYAWKDKFISPYMGKDYGGGAYELVSMGLELLYKDPYSFMKRDPEMFEWIIDTIRGIE